MAQSSELGHPEDPEGKEQTEEERESIWTIPAKYKGWYFGLFSVQVVIATAWLVRTAIVENDIKGISETLLFVWQSLAPIAITSATFALVIIDTWKTTMVFGTWLEDELKKRRQRQIKVAVEKAVEQAVEKAVEETRDAERKVARQFSNKLRGWNQRRETAAAAGEQFNEPPPNIDDIDIENSQRDE